MTYFNFGSPTRVMYKSPPPFVFVAHINLVPIPGTQYPQITMLFRLDEFLINL